MRHETRHRVCLPGALIARFGDSCPVTDNRRARRALSGHLKAPLVAVILAFIPALALGQSMRCGSKLITEGVSQAKVAALCGQPVQVVHPPAYDGVAPGASDVEEEIWIYNFGPNRLMRRIRFRNGIVATIGSVGYGY